jgi:hypothetical protein
MKMTKLWKEVKGLVKGTNVDKDNLDRETGLCTVDLIGGEFDGWAVAGRVVDGDYYEVIIDDEAIVYNPAE